MKKIYEIALSSLMLLTLAGCTLMLDVMPEEEEKPEEEVDLDKVGFDKPYTQVVEGLGSCTYQYDDSTKVFVREMFDYIVDVDEDTIIYLADNIPSELLIQPGFYVSRGSCLEFPYGLMHKVVDLVHRNGMYEMHMLRVTEKEIFKKYELRISAELDLSTAESYESPSNSTRSSKGGEDGVHAVSWSLFKEIPAPISKKSAYSSKLRMPRRHTTRADDDSPKNLFRASYNSNKDGCFSFEFPEASNDKIWVPAGSVNLAPLFEKLKFSDTVKGILSAFFFQLTITDIGGNPKFEDYKNIYYDDDGYKREYERQEKTETTKYGFSLKGGVDLAKLGAMGRDAAWQFFKKDVLGKNSPLGTVFDRYYAVDFIIPVISVPATVRFKFNPDLIVMTEGEHTWELDRGTIQTTTEFFDGKEQKPEEKTIREGKGLCNFDFLKDGYLYVKALIGIEAMIGVGSSKTDAVGAGLYLEPSWQWTFNDNSTKNGDIHIYNENPITYESKVDIYFKAGAWKLKPTGEEAWWFGTTWLLKTAWPETENALPDFCNFWPTIPVENLMNPISNKISVTYTMDKLGKYIRSFWPGLLTSDRFYPGIHVYERDGEGKIKGNPKRFYDTNKNIKKDETYEFEVGLFGDERDKSYIVVPVIAQESRVLGTYWDTEYHELRYAAKTVEKEKYAELRPVDLILLKSTETPTYGLYKFDFMMNAYNVEMIKTNGWTDVIAIFNVWRYDKAMDHWKLLGRMRKQIKDLLQPGKIGYDLIGQFGIEYTEEEKENSDNYEFYLTAGLFHELLSGSFYDFIHLVKDGISCYERMDRNAEDPDVYSLRIKLVDGASGSSRGLTRIDVQSKGGDIK